MRQLFIVFFVILLPQLLYAQVEKEPLSGTVSFVSSRNVYVKFASTQNINVGDTLFVMKNNQKVPGMIVSNKSSVSCVCTPIEPNKFEVGDTVQSFAAKKPEEKTDAEENKEDPDNEIVKLPDEDKEVSPEKKASTAGKAKVRKRRTNARVSAASYSTFSNNENKTTLRYAFIYRGNNIKDSKFSWDHYIVYRHRLNPTDSLQNSLGNAFKVYSFAGQYQFTDNTSLTIGRKINPRISSLGAVDGVQFEKTFGQRVHMGVLLGSRPRLRDYGIDPSLMQGGVYMSLNPADKNKNHQPTLGFIEQRNGGNVDRRFVYGQYNGTLGNGLNFFGSMEMDLYKKVNDTISNKPQMTNLYVMLRYRVSRKFSTSIAYDNRKNIIFYESYKNQIDQLIDQETRQGLRYQFSYRPVKKLTIGLNSSFRFQKGQTSATTHFNTYVNYSSLPFINANISVSASFLKTSYLSTQNFGVKLSRSFARGKFSTELYYRNINYQYLHLEHQKLQNLVGGSCSVRLARNLSFSLYAESVFDDQNNNYTRLNAKLLQRF